MRAWVPGTLVVCFVLLAWGCGAGSDDAAPIACARVDRGSEGRFEIDASHGPTPGPHRVEIRHEGDIHPYDASGAYSMAEPVCRSTQIEIVEGEPIELALGS